MDVRAKDINDEMKIAAAKAIASLVNGTELNENYIIPTPFIISKEITGIYPFIVKDAPKVYSQIINHIFIRQPAVSVHTPPCAP